MQLGQDYHNRETAEKLTVWFLLESMGVKGEITQVYDC